MSDVRVPTAAAERKALPICTGCLDYFPDALLAVAKLSRIGNEQHNPGEPLHWAKEKSTDEADAMLRHLIDRGKLDADGVRHSAKVAWRALANLQREIDAERSTEAVVPVTADDRKAAWDRMKHEAEVRAGLHPSVSSQYDEVAKALDRKPF